MKDADALSRQFQEENKEQKINEIRKTDNQKLGEEKKHKITLNGVDYWEFDTGKRAEMPKDDKRNELVAKIHTDLNHIGVKGTYYALKQKYYG